MPSRAARIRAQFDEESDPTGQKLHRSWRSRMAESAGMKGLAGLAFAIALTALAGAQDVVRTADVNIRGLKASDFPRTKRLADGVYSYEQIDPTKRTVTVNNLIVVTSEGVVVVEGQGTVDNV